MRGQELKDKPVRACFCFPHDFEELKTLSARHGWRCVEEVTESTGCGGGCGLCRQYLSLMLVTGETEFEILPLEPSGQIVWKS